MFEIDEELSEALKAADRIIISNKADKTYKYRKVEIHAIYLKGKRIYQVSCYTDKQVFQENIGCEVVCKYVGEHFPVKLCQMNIFAAGKEYSYKMTSKGRLLKNIRKSNIITRCEPETNTHNRKKKYILQEGVVVPPLVDMGIFTKDGRVVKSMYDKYKQINRFVELVDDVLKDEKKPEINIIDFGCGKSYLTFIIYYYMTEILHKKVNVVGLDLKEDVIAHCNEAARKYGYDNLHFEMGDINGYHTDMRVDMVVTLHACDTATDYALYNAVLWNAKYILSVPCCQHEVNGQISSETLAPMMKYGIIKERMSALATDAVRGELLEYRGYRTNLLEFVDMTHSPKNILIRAVKANISTEKRNKALNEVRNMCDELHIEPTLYKLFTQGDKEI